MDVKDIHVLIKIKVSKFLLNSTFVLILFCIDRLSQIYVIEPAEKPNVSEIYLTSFSKTKFLAVFDLLRKMGREICVFFWDSLKIKCKSFTHIRLGTVVKYASS